MWVISMRILIISDTHDNLQIVDKILEHAKNVDEVIHCGDYISPFTIKRLLGIEKPIIGVWGNNDGDKLTILKIISGSKFTIEYPPREIEIGKFNCLIMHGWGPPKKTKKIVQSIAKGGDWKIVIYGHTHLPDISIIKKDGTIESYVKLWNGKMIQLSLDLEQIQTLILNPGEASGWLYGKPSGMKLLIEDSKVTVKLIRF